jgi:hypothetical protein
MTVPLNGVANAQYVTVAVSNVAATDGSGGGNASVRLGFLLGDANGSRTVSLSDMIAVNAGLTQPLTYFNFLQDIDASGAITLSDMLLVNGNLTHVLPSP